MEWTVKYFVDHGGCEDIWWGSDYRNCGVCPDCVECKTRTVKHFHMNWGWGENGGNGWFKASGTNAGQFHSYMRVYTNIRP